MITAKFKGSKAANRYAEAIRSAAVRSINTTMTTLKTESRRTFVKDVGTKIKTMKPRARVLYKANKNNPSSILTLNPYAIPLYWFNAKRVKVKSPDAKRGPRWRYGVRISGKRKGIVPNAFIAEVGTGKHAGVFERRTSRRLPIRELFVKKELVESLVRQKAWLMKRAKKRFGEVFARNLAFVRSKF